jgi:adenosine deaminase
MMDFVSLPKIELHVHLDTSLSFQVVQELQPEITKEEYEQNFVVPPKCHDLADYIARADASITLMQTPEQLRLVTLDLLRQMKEDHVLYAEIRFAPLQHLQKGLSPEEVVDVVSDALVEGEETYGVKSGLLLCTLRHFSEEQSMQTVKLAHRGMRNKVVGFDIAADEAKYAIDNHVAAFEYAQQHEIPRTAHAGEACGAESVWETLRQFRPQRIGHGVRSVEDPKLLGHLRNHDIHLEVCPTSNIQTDVFDTMEDHVVSQLFDAGISLGINTDGRGLSNVSLADEYQTLHDVFGWEKSRLLKCNTEALRHAFCEPSIKEKLLPRLKAAYTD